MKQVLILGAGYGSLSFLKALPARVRKECAIRLISESSLHYFSVLLHDVLAGVEGQHTLELSTILPPEVEFIQDRVLEVQEGRVVGQEGVYPYDNLIVGLGFNSDSFGVQGVEAHTHSLVNFTSAQATHEALCNAIDAFQELRPFHVVVCGGGFSGVELLGALSDTLPSLCTSKDFKFTCIEALPNILPMFESKLVQKGVAYLQHLGVSLEVETKILECQHDRVVVMQNQERKEILADFILWTCGVRGNAVIESSPFFKSVRSRVEVNSYLEPVDMPQRGIFILGDCAALKNSEGRLYPPTAQLASQMGTYLGRQWAHVLANKSPSTPFRFQEKGIICSLGTRYAIGHVGIFHVSGKLGIWLKKYIEWRWKRSLLV
ncbi:NAD(P)/FAD-dependent oxidoreductase [Helicobacter baculiformis]|uniref:NAD(P)/FAD-dependent oxidoreductase n=1 Tax=Helicobacter baculiformis TaxID=427351 RepID=A0ABV7ZHY0_9HELI